MAESNAHRWGQIIGDVFEQFVRDMLKGIAEKHELISITRSRGGHVLNKVAKICRK